MEPAGVVNVQLWQLCIDDSQRKSHTSEADIRCIVQGNINGKLACDIPLRFNREPQRARLAGHHLKRAVAKRKQRIGK